jgi:hypothetical protein
MEEAIYSVIQMLLGDGVTTEVSNDIASLFESLEKAFGKTGAVPIVIDALSGVAASMVIALFLYNIIQKSTNEMLTPEKLILGFVKLIIALSVLFYLKDILYYICMFGNYLFQGMKDQNLTANAEDYRSKFVFFKKGVFLKDAGKYPTYKSAQKKFGDDFMGYYTEGIIKGPMRCLGLMMRLAIPYVVMWIVRIAAYFVVFSQAVMFLTTAAFSPIAVVQIFDESQRGAAISYFKKLLAYSSSFACIVIAMKAVSYLSPSFGLSAEVSKSLSKIGGIYGDNEDHANIGDVLTWGNCLALLIPQVVTIGVISGSTKIAHDFFK